MVDIRELNRMIESAPEKLVEQAEIGYRRQLIEIADEVFEKRESCQVLLIAGRPAQQKQQRRRSFQNGF